MGYALPASIGACLANNNQEVICIDGDGSSQLNLQELQTIKQYKLPIKIFILNNKGYHSIVQTQNNFFKGDFIGCNEESNVSFPDNSKLADVYGLNYFKINSYIDIDYQIDKVLNCKCAVLCEVILPTDYIFMPKLSSEKQKDGTMISKPLEDMYPFLDRDDFNLNMVLDKDKR
jgi:acetolactate synthase-1/2/3 large subunit